MRVYLGLKQRDSVEQEVLTCLDGPATQDAKRVALSSTSSFPTRVLFDLVVTAANPQHPSTFKVLSSW
jgi:hypothetical protein